MYPQGNEILNFDHFFILFSAEMFTLFLVNCFLLFDPCCLLYRIEPMLNAASLPRDLSLKEIQNDKEHYRAQFNLIKLRFSIRSMS